MGGGTPLILPLTLCGLTAISPRLGLAPGLPAASYSCVFLYPYVMGIRTKSRTSNRQKANNVHIWGTHEDCGILFSVWLQRGPRQYAHWDIIPIWRSEIGIKSIS